MEPLFIKTIKQYELMKRMLILVCMNKTRRLPIERHYLHFSSKSQNDYDMTHTQPQHIHTYTYKPINSGLLLQSTSSFLHFITTLILDVECNFSRIFFSAEKNKLLYTATT